MTGDVRRVLVVRNDKLGDFTLALPSFELLKRVMPQVEVFALVPQYTRPLAAMSPAIDALIEDPGEGARGGSPLALASRLAAYRLDAVITLYSTARVGAAVMLARIPRRLAPATKAAQFFYNDRLVQRRSRSTQPEYEYNLDLVRHFVLRQGCEHRRLELRRPVIAADPERTSARRAELAARYALPLGARWIFVHPGSGGSANNLDVEQYAQLIELLGPGDRHAVVVTAGPGEQELARRLVARLSCRPTALYHSEHGLADFIQTLATADLVIGGSTGVLHLAGALDLPTAGFYPRNASGSALRWQTLNREGRRLAFMPAPGGAERDMRCVDLGAAAQAIAMLLGESEAVARGSRG